MSAVYSAIAAVQGELAKVGIAKNRRNTQGSGYNFRGIDDVYSALSPLLAAKGLVVVPRMIERSQVERASKNGGALFYTTVKAEFDFVAVEDGSKHTACTYGEAMDSGDKSTNKAMSAAYKYAAFMTFAIPTEGDNDADATTHDVAANDRNTGTISKAEADELDSLAAASGADVNGLLDYVGAPQHVQRLCELPASLFAKTKAALETKLAGKKVAANA
jgi:hypothetical protein